MPRTIVKTRIKSTTYDTLSRRGERLERRVVLGIPEGRDRERDLSSRL